jgi:protein SCO1/2
MNHNTYNFYRLPVAAVACVLAAAASLLPSTRVHAQYRPDFPIVEGTPTAVENKAIVEKPNAQIPLDLTFTRSDGTPVKLGDAFKQDKPVILSLVYFSCPNLCGFTQESLLEFVRTSPHGITLGKDYDILVVSIDHEDTSKDAALKRKNYLAKVPLPETQSGFTYLTGSKENIRKLADTVGFPFHFNPPNTDSDKIAHASGIFVCTPEGRLSQTILGVQYEPELLHFRLREASGGKIGGTLLGAALSCGAMWFNPNTGKYEHNPYFWAGTGTAILSILFVGTFLTFMWKGEKDRSKALAAAENADSSSQDSTLRTQEKP